MAYPVAYQSFFLYGLIHLSMLILVGGFNPSEKYESQIGSSSQLLGKIKKVPNHQPVIYQS
jgi:hypothetical protein